MSVLWATGYKLNFSFIYASAMDEWSCHKHHLGVMEVSGTKVVALQRLTCHYFAIVGEVGLESK